MRPSTSCHHGLPSPSSLAVGAAKFAGHRSGRSEWPPEASIEQAVRCHGAGRCTRLPVGHDLDEDLDRQQTIVSRAARGAKAPSTEKRTVSLGRLPNAEYRTREYLTEAASRQAHRDCGEDARGVR
jgi:hypothetical protein